MALPEDQDAVQEFTAQGTYLRSLSLIILVMAARCKEAR
jgi:hypothetical protein